MGKRLICAFLAIVVFLTSCPTVYASNFSDPYNSGVSAAILNKSSKEKIEREFLRVFLRSGVNKKMHGP